VFRGGFSFFALFGWCVWCLGCGIFVGTGMEWLILFSAFFFFFWRNHNVMIYCAHISLACLTHGNDSPIAFPELGSFCFLL